MTNKSQTPEPAARLNRRLFVGGSAAAAALVINGTGLTWGASVSRAAQEDGPEIIIGTLGEAQTINPFVLSGDSEGSFRCKMLYDEFVRVNPTSFEPEPGLAEEWTIEDLVFTFTIRDNATFSDGSDVTADDVAFTLMGLLAKETASPNQVKFLSIAGAQEYADGTADAVSGIEVVDPKTLRITLAQPDAPFLFNLRVVYVVPKAALEGKTLTDDPFFQAPVGAGPFVFEKWDTGADFVATRNPNYWQEGKPALARFTHRTIADANSLVLALDAGDIDGSNYPAPTAKEQLETNANLSVIVPPFGYPNGWMFNCTNEWLAKKEVRRAIAMALNTEQFAADSLMGLGKPGLGPIAPGNWAHDPTLTPIPYDVAAAKELITASGMPEGTKIRFTVNQGNVLREDWLTYTQQALQEIGIEVVPEPIEYATLVEQVTSAKDYDACGVDFAGATEQPSDLYDAFHSKSSGNYMGYANPELDALLEQARQELDLEVAKGIYQQIQQIIMDEVPTFYAWYRPFLHVISKEFTGYTDSISYGGLFHMLEDFTVAE